MKPFQNLKVIELASVLAGPAVGLFFAELGAKVIKIENKLSGGDVTRIWHLPSESKEGISAYYSSVNWNKEIRFVNLKDKDERQSIHELIADADIVISNFRKDIATKLEMDYTSLKKIKEDIILAELNGYGVDAHRPAFDVVLQAETGYLYMTGRKGEKPVKMPVALIDVLAAHQLKEAILIALLKKTQTGGGSHITSSLFETGIASLSNQATNWLMAGHIPQPMGCKHPNIAPYGDLFLTKDQKYVVTASGSEAQFQKLCTLLGLQELIIHPKFATNQQRLIYRAELNTHLQEKISSYKRDELLSKMEEENVPMGAVKNMQEVFQDPLAKNMILEQKEKDGSTSKRVKTVAFHFLD